LSYVRLKHTLSAIALESLAGKAAADTSGGAALLAPAMAAYARRSEAGRAVPADVLAGDVGAAPEAVRSALAATGLFTARAGGIGLAGAYRPYAAYFRRQVDRVGEALRLAAQPRPADVSLEVHRGAALFNAGLFFECHEYFEDVWRESRPSERTFYHGLVQAAAGCYHAEKGNRHGTAVLLGKAAAKLAPFAPSYLGLDVAALIASLKAVQDGAPARQAVMAVSGRAARPQLCPPHGDRRRASHLWPAPQAQRRRS
jgi:hypothetical protein